MAFEPNPIICPLSLKPRFSSGRRGERERCPRELEDQMRGLGKVFLTGVAAVVLWKVFAALFIGVLGMALKVALVIGVIYLAMKVFQNDKKDKID